MRCYLQHQAAEEVKLDCWYMDDSEEDQRKPHRQSPNVPATVEELHKVGVISWKLNADDPENDPALAAIRKVRHCPQPTNVSQHQMAWNQPRSVVQT